MDRTPAQTACARFFDSVGVRVHLFNVPRAFAVLFILVLLSGCAFPLFNLEERSRPRTLAYRPSRAGSSVEPPSESRSEQSRPTPALGPRRRSVMDPSPRELDDDSSSTACYGALRETGVAWERVAEPTPGVKWPIRLKGPVRGVLFQPLERGDRMHAVLDCRLALSLVSWARDLRRARVRKVEYYSMYRPGARVGGTGAVSGHAHAMAIDAAKFELESGVVLDVLHDWEHRERGSAPCPVRRDESSGSRLLRNVLCQAVDRKLFQVVLTPHYNRAHANHLHLERKPNADWFYVK
jgi:hypothetical protein